IFDHFLARAFAEYSERPLPEFAEDVYQTLRVYPGDYTARGRRIVANMTQNRWLESYVEIEGLQPALTFLGAKLRFENPLKEALPLLRELEAPLAQAFYQFWPELIAFAREQGAFGPQN
ncbi:MAG: acyl carrier protein phosphodiesterase, partial [Acidobacteria bacterium]|nr:acyl carrier protein phosphodiesterase [Acidobacteriota bacterium]